MESHKHIAAAFKNVSNSFALTVPPISNKKVAGRNVVALKILAHLRTGDMEGVTAQILQSQAVMNSPISSSVSWLSDRRAVHNPNLEAAPSFFKAGGPLDPFQNLETHPVEPFLRHFESMKQGGVIDAAKIRLMSISNRSAKRFSTCQVNQQYSQKGWRRVNFSLAGQCTQFECFFFPSRWQKPQQNFPIILSLWVHET